MVFQPELKALVRLGVPHEHRATIWKYCIEQCVQETRSLAGDGYYANLLENMKGKHSPAVKQIELDLLRTLPNNKHYDKLDADGVSKWYCIISNNKHLMTGPEGNSH